MLIGAYNTVDRTRNLLKHTIPAKKLLVINGVVQPGYEDAVAAILQSSGYGLMPANRIHGKPVVLESKATVLAKRINPEPEAISLEVVLQSERQFIDEDEALQDRIPFREAA